MKKNFNTFNLVLLAVSLFALPNCAKKRPNDTALSGKYTFDEYKQKVVLALEKDGRDEAKRHLEKMIESYPEYSETEHYRLKLADLYFEEGKKEHDSEYLKMACNLYKRFYKLNPSDPNAEYASYQRINSELNQANKIDCDTSSYEKTLKLCKKHLAKAIFKGGKFESEVRNIKYTCERLLIDKEVYVFNSCLRSEQLNTAKSRLEYIRENYLSAHPDLAPRLDYLACKLALANKDKILAEEKIKILDEKYKDSEFRTMAHNLIAKHEFRNHFIF